MTIHLIRHGTTTTSGVAYAGRSDVALNAEGRRMAEDLARNLSSRPITQILSSPLSRAVDTAAPLARARGLDIITDARLLEFDFGTYEGRPKRELGLTLRKTHARTPVPGGEALIDVWERAGLFLSSLQSRTGAKDGEIAVFGHFWINRMLFGQASGLDFAAACRSRDYRPRTGSAIVIRPRTPESEVAGDMHPTNDARRRKA